MLLCPGLVMYSSQTDFNVFALPYSLAYAVGVLIEMSLFIILISLVTMNPSIIGILMSMVLLLRPISSASCLEKLS